MDSGGQLAISAILFKVSCECSSYSPPKDSMPLHIKSLKYVLLNTTIVPLGIVQEKKKTMGMHKDFATIIIVILINNTEKKTSTTANSRSWLRIGYLRAKPKCRFVHWSILLTKLGRMIPQRRR